MKIRLRTLLLGISLLCMAFALVRWHLTRLSARGLLDEIGADYEFTSWGGKTYLRQGDFAFCENEVVQWDKTNTFWRDYGLFSVNSVDINSAYRRPAFDMALKQLPALGEIRTVCLRSANSAQEVSRLASLPQCQSLSLTQSTLNDDATVAIPANLQNLDLSCVNGLSAQILRSFGNCAPRIKTLNLACSKADDNTLEGLAEFHELETLILDGTGVTDKGIAHLVALRNLKRLSLRNTPVTGSGFEKFPQNFPLEMISMRMGLGLFARSAFGDTVLPRIDVFTEAKVRPISLVGIGNLKNLRVLDLVGRSVPAIDSELKQLSNLNTLMLDDRSLTQIYRNLQTLNKNGCMTRLHVICTASPADVPMEIQRRLRVSVEANSPGLADYGVGAPN